MSDIFRSKDEVVVACEQELTAAHHETELQRILAVQRATLHDLRTMHTALMQRNTHIERLTMQLQAALTAQKGELPGARQDMDAVYRSLTTLQQASKKGKDQGGQRSAPAPSEAQGGCEAEAEK